MHIHGSLSTVNIQYWVSPITVFQWLKREKEIKRKVLPRQTQLIYEILIFSLCPKRDDAQ